MQPTYLPWSGYFNLIANVDYFVFLDNVQYERRSWQMRNRILLNGREHLLTVPLKKCPQSTLLNEIQVSEDADWRKRHWDIIETAYRKSPYGIVVLDLLHRHYYGDEVSDLLSNINQGIIIDISNALKLKTMFVRASNVTSFGLRSERLASLCKSLSCDSYLSPAGSMDYLLADSFDEKYNILLEFQNYNPSNYKQYKANVFVSHLSVIDVIANIGLENAIAYVKGELVDE